MLCFPLEWLSECHQQSKGFLGGRLLPQRKRRSWNSKSKRCGHGLQLKVDMALVSELELLMGRLGEAVSPQTSVFLGCAGHKCGLMGVAEVAQTETASENIPAYGDS